MPASGATTWLFILLATVPIAAQDVYRSDFGTAATQPAQLPEWQMQDGRYWTETGWLHIVSDKSNPQATLRFTHDGDGTYRAVVRNAEHCHRSMLLAKGVYQLEINNQFGRLALQRLADKQWKLVGDAKNYGLYVRNGHMLELRLVFVGRRVCAFIDGKKLIDYQDPEPVPPGGRYGLVGGWGSDVAWRDIRLYDQPDLAEWPMEPAVKTAAKDLVEVTWVRGLADDGIYFDKDQAGLRFKLTTHQPLQARVHLVYRLIDVRQRTVAEKSDDMMLTGGVETPVTVQFTPPGRGCFKIALYAGAGDADTGWVEDLGSFTVVPRALGERPPNPDSYFGGHMDGVNLEWHLRCGRKLGVQWARCHDMLQHTWWTRIQPDGPDQWLWQDKTQSLIDAGGMATLGEFLWTPSWASIAKSGNRQTAPPSDAATFERYVAGTVGHYRRSIHYWEVWNEPHYSGFWTGTPEEYAKLLQSAFAQAKKADPDCIVLGGGGVDLGHSQWVEAMFKALSGKPMDAFSIHYLAPDTAVEEMNWLRGLLRQHDLEVPIWDTEASVVSSSFLDQNRTAWMEPEARYHFRNACSELVRMYMENISNGVRRVFYYDLADPWRFKEFPKPRVMSKEQPGNGMWDEGRMLKPIGAACAALAYAIDGQAFKARIAAGPLHVFIFEGKDWATAVQYAMFPRYSILSNIHLRLPDGARHEDFGIMDFMGNESSASFHGLELICPLSHEPLYLTCHGKNAADVLKRMYTNAVFPTTMP